MKHYGKNRDYKCVGELDSGFDLLIGKDGGCAIGLYFVVVHEFRKSAPLEDLIQYINQDIERLSVDGLRGSAFTINKGNHAERWMFLDNGGQKARWCVMSVSAEDAETAQMQLDSCLSTYLKESAHRVRTPQEIKQYTETFHVSIEYVDEEERL